jgi:MFS family permease
MDTDGTQQAVSGTALTGDGERLVANVEERLASTGAPVVERAGDVPSARSDPRRWVALVVILAGSFIAGMDGFIVNVAIPSIQKGLGTSFAAIQFVVAGYSLSYAVLLITGGRLGDLYGRKRFFIVGMAGFLVTSALCGLAFDPVMLIVSRILQGAAAALLFPQVLALIRVIFQDEKERDRAFGWYGVVIGLSQACGLVLGGLLLAANIFGLSWRPLFLINLPVGAVALALAGTFIPETRLPTAQKLDLGGVVLISLGLALFVFPLVQGRQMGWPWWVFLCLVASVLLLVAFFFYERFVARQNGSPLLNQALLRNFPFLRGLLMVIVFFAAPAAFLLIVTFYLQTGLGLTPFLAGLVTLPLALGVLLASFAANTIRGRIGRHVLTSGAGSMLIGLLVCIVTLALSGGKPGSLVLLPPLFLIGFGFGLVLSPLVNILLSGIAPMYAGAASGMVGTAIQIGLSLGVALIGIVFFNLLADQATYAVAFTWSLVAIVIALVLTIGLVFSLPETRR